MKTYLVIMLVHLVSGGNNFENEITKFCSKQNCNFLTLTNLQNDQKILMKNSMYGLRSRFLEFEGILEFLDFYDTWIVHDSTGEYFELILEIAQQHRIQRSILILPETKLNSLIEIADNLKKNAFIYVLTYDSDNFKWRKIITMNDSPKSIGQVSH